MGSYRDDSICRKGKAWDFKKGRNFPPRFFATPKTYVFLHTAERRKRFRFFFHKKVGLICFLLKGGSIVQPWVTEKRIMGIISNTSRELFSEWSLTYRSYRWMTFQLKLPRNPRKPEGKFNLTPMVLEGPESPLNYGDFGVSIPHHPWDWYNYLH